MHDLPRLPPSVHQLHQSGKTLLAFQFRQFCLAAVAAQQFRLSLKHSTGTTVCSWVQSWLQKQQQQLAAQ
jgi:hypothetical protein